MRRTEESHIDYDEITRSTELMRNLAVMVNEAKRKEEEFTKMFQIQKEVENCPVSQIIHLFIIFNVVFNIITVKVMLNSFWMTQIKKNKKTPKKQNKPKQKT